MKNDVHEKTQTHADTSADTTPTTATKEHVMTDDEYIAALNALTTADGLAKLVASLSERD